MSLKNFWRRRVKEREIESFGGIDTEGWVQDPYTILDKGLPPGHEAAQAINDAIKRKMGIK